MRTSWSLALAVVLAWVGPAFASGPHWYRVRSLHFTLYDSDDRETVLRLARGLERMAETIAEMGFGSTTGPHPRTVLIAFPDEKSFKPHQPVYKGQRRDLAGYVVHSPYGQWIGFVASSEQGRMVAHHEYTHTIVADAFREVPPCLNEGLAEYFSTFQERDRSVEFGHPIERYRDVLQREEPMSLDKLFAVTAESPAYNDPARVGVFYAESWALVHYLASSAGLTGLLMEFVNWIAAGTAPREAFQTLYPSESWVRMPFRLRSYVDSNGLAYHEKVYNEPLGRIAIVIEDVTSDEVEANIGIWRAANSEMSASQTERILDHSARGARGLASAGQGVLALREGNPQAAAARFRAAAASDDPVAVSIGGIGMIQVGQERDSTGHDPLVTEGHQVLSRAVARDSSDALARKWLAASAASADVGGVPVWAAADSVEALVAARRYDDALALLDRIAVTVGPERALSVAATREGIERRRAIGGATTEYNLGVDAVNRGDYPDAQRRFGRARDLAPEGDLKAKATSSLAQIAGLYEYNRGVDAAKKNDLAGALTWFEKAYQAAQTERVKTLSAARVKELRPRVAPTKPAGRP